MIKCIRCKEQFTSEIAYITHIRMRKRVGYRSICPTSGELRRRGMDTYQGAWLFREKEERIGSDAPV
jgi:hypothetical protein